MTKTLVATLVAGTLCGALSGAASAQSNVTLWGILDVGVRQVKNGTVGTINSLSSGGTATSRFGLKGVEDLGGGLKAAFWLESDIAVDTGATNATFWNRRSTVSLISNTWGEIRLGRELLPTHVASCTIDSFSCVGMAAGTTFRSTQAAVFAGIGGVQVAFRSNNGISYFTPPNLGGFSAQLLVSAGEGQPSLGTENAKSQAVRLGYRGHGLTIQLATRQVKNATPAVGTFDDSVVAASYDFGPMTVGLQQRRFKWSVQKLAVSMAHLSAPIGGGTLRLTWQKADQQSPNAVTNANDATLLGVGYQYYISKRTSVYGTATQIANKNRATFAVAGGPAVTAANFGGQKSSAWELGMRHDF